MHRSFIEQISIGKDIVEQYYGEQPHHTYWNGCSQGGRQWYAIAQRNPGVVDGILAAAPAINLVSVAIGGHWPQVVMNEANTFLSQCEFDWFRKKLMEECDALDGYEDGVLNDPEECQHDPGQLIGSYIKCDGEAAVKVTPQMVDVVRQIREGPKSSLGAKFWHGLAPGASYLSTANISISPEGVRSINPNGLPLVNDALLPPGTGFSAVSRQSYFAMWTQAFHEWQWSMEAETVELAALRDSGVKMITWHGLADDIIPYKNTLVYRERVEHRMGGAGEVDKFYRVFLAPGVVHCFGGRGPVPIDPMAALVDWVEKGKAPDSIDGATSNEAGDRITRKLCKWPAKAMYNGAGDPKRAASWACSNSSTGWAKVGHAEYQWHDEL